MNASLCKPVKALLTIFIGVFLDADAGSVAIMGIELKFDILTSEHV